MLAFAGTVGLGLVWGWLAVRLSRGARWTVVVRVVLGLAAQAELAQLLLPLGALWFGGGVLGGIFLALSLVRALEARIATEA